MVVNGKCSTTCLLLLGIIAAIYILLLSTSKIYTCMYHVCIFYFKLSCMILKMQSMREYEKYKF